MSVHHGKLHCYGILDFAAKFKGLASELFDLCICHILVWLQGLRVW